MDQNRIPERRRTDAIDQAGPREFDGDAADLAAELLGTSPNMDQTLRALVVPPPVRRPPRMSFEEATSVSSQDALTKVNAARLEKASSLGTDRVVMQLASLIMTREAEIMQVDDPDVQRGFAEVVEFLKLFRHLTVTQANS